MQRWLIRFAGLLMLVACGAVQVAPIVPDGASAAPPLGSATTTVTPHDGPQIGGCPLLPADNIWNAPVDRLPVHPRSAQYIASIGANTGVHPDFGAGEWQGGPIGIPFVIVPANQPMVTIISSNLRMKAIPAHTQFLPTHRENMAAIIMFWLCARANANCTSYITPNSLIQRPGKRAAARCTI